jgi:nucleoside 2-deoxyribosyltransferase
MKIAICGSMKFAKEMLTAEEQLREMGHEPILPIDTFECVENPALNQNVDFCINNDIIRDHLRKIKESDAILVLNLTKGKIRGYVGSSTLMEIGFAHYLNKEIYLFDRIPNQPCSVEIKIMKPKVLYRNLAAINDEFSIQSELPLLERSGRVYQQVFLWIENKPWSKAALIRKRKRKKNRLQSVVHHNQISNYIDEDSSMCALH